MTDIRPAKICTCCQESKPIEDFPGKKKKSAQCKECHAARSRRWRFKNAERKRKQNQRYYRAMDVSDRNKPNVIDERKRKRKECQAKYRRNVVRVYNHYKEHFEANNPDHEVLKVSVKKRRIYNIYKGQYIKEVGELE